MELAKDKRFSCRSYKPDMIEQEKLDYILEAGRIAPTAANFQPQRILVLSGEEGMAKVKECTNYCFGQPVTMLICYDNTTVWKNTRNNAPGGDVDSAIVITHMMLAAAEQGLGTLWIGGFSHVKAREVFDIPEYLVPVAMMAFGYPSDDCKPHPWHDVRFDRDHSVFFNTFKGITEGEKY